MATTMERGATQIQQLGYPELARIVDELSIVLQRDDNVAELGQLADGLIVTEREEELPGGRSWLIIPELEPMLPHVIDIAKQLARHHGLTGAYMLRYISTHWAWDDTRLAGLILIDSIMSQLTTLDDNPSRAELFLWTDTLIQREIGPVIIGLAQEEAYKARLYNGLDILIEAYGAKLSDSMIETYSVRAATSDDEGAFAVFKKHYPDHAKETLTAYVGDLGHIYTVGSGTILRPLIGALLASLANAIRYGADVNHRGSHGMVLWLDKLQILLKTISSQTSGLERHLDNVGIVAAILEVIKRYGAGSINEDTYKDVEVALIDTAAAGYENEELSLTGRVALESIIDKIWRRA